MSKILIIGNGFDINLGVETSYIYFVNSRQFYELLKTSNELAKHLHRKQSSQNWVDIEHELKYYLAHKFRITDPTSKNDQIMKFKSEFTALKNSLMKYLQDQTDLCFEKLKQCQDYQATKVIRHGYLKHYETHKKHKPPFYFDDIYTFNYTNFFGNFSYEEDSNKLCSQHHVHGSLKDSNIVFGIEDNAFSDEVLKTFANPALHLQGIKKYDFSFLNKSDHSAFGKAPDVSRAITSAGEIHFFGCSLGDTDNAHFSRAFKECSTQSPPNNQPSEKRRIYFYVYGKEGYRNIYNRIMILTENRVSEFKLINDVTFYDLKEDKEIDQEWLNA